MRNTAGNKNRQNPPPQVSKQVEISMDDFVDVPAEDLSFVSQEPEQEAAAQDTTAPTVTVEGETKGGRNILITRTRDGRFFTISYEGGGVVAPELDGIFTSHENAAWAITAYKQRKGL